jgi:pyruvate dehydrogenase E1 component beta subunit
MAAIAYSTRRLSESAIVGLANGAALCGLRPVAEIMFADFFGVCFDQLVNNAAKLNFMFQGKAKCPITVRAPQGAGIRCAYHHSACVESWFLNTPGLVVVCPTTPYEAKGMLVAAIRNDNPVIFLEHKMLYNTRGEVPEELYEVPLYKANIEREGKDVTILALQMTLGIAHKAAAKLEQDGISAEIINLRTLAPYDKETVMESVAKTGRLVIAQEGPKTGGWAAELSAMIADDMFEYLRAPIKRVTSMDVPIAFAPVMEDYVLPSAEKIEAACRELAGYGF